MISVIIATRNRQRELQQMLESLARATPPAGNWEVIVIDNASSDGTGAVISELGRGGRLPLRRLLEPQLGKTFACNLGVRSSRGALLLFTDDDTLIDREWLTSMERAAARWPAAACFGGRVIAIESSPRPAWFPAEGPLRACTGGVLAFDLGDEPLELRADAPASPVGANLVCRRETLTRHGLFREDLGPGPLKYHGDDTEFFNRLRRANELVMYVPDAVVRHPVDPKRLRRSYAIRWAYHVGRTSARMRGRRPGVRLVGSVPRYLFRMLARDFASLWASGLSGTPAERQRRLQAIAGRLGTISELHRLPRDFDRTRYIPALGATAAPFEARSTKG